MIHWPKKEESKLVSVILAALIGLQSILPALLYAIIFSAVTTTAVLNDPQPVYADEFTNNASGTWTAPTGAYSVTVEVWGGGGGGGTGSNTGVQAGGGGAGGQYAIKANISVTPGYNYSYVVASGGGSDTVGGDSYFIDTSTVLAKGGAGGTNAGGGGGGGAGSSANGIGDTVYRGGNGGNAPGGAVSGAGGGGAGSGGNGGDAVGSTVGTGTADNGGDGGASVSSGNSVGNSGLIYGGGGSGGSRTGGGTRAGGAGAGGFIRISYSLNEINIQNDATISDQTPGQGTIFTAQRFRINVTGSATINSMDITLKGGVGSARDVDITSIKIYKDFDNNNVWNPGTDIDLGGSWNASNKTTDSDAKGTITFSTPETISSETDFWVIVETSGSANNGRFIQTELNSGSDVSYVKLPVDNSSYPITSEQHTITVAASSTLTITTSSVTADPSNYLYKGDVGKAIQMLTLSATGDDVTVNSIDIDYTGSSPWSNIDLYVAEDDGSVPDQYDANDTTIANTTPGTNDWLWEPQPPSSFVVTSGYARKLFLVTDIADGATSGYNVEAQILNTSSVNSNADVETDNFPLNSDVFPINAGNIEAQNNVSQPGAPGGILTEGYSQVPLHRIVLSPSVGGVTVNSLKVTLSSSDLASGHIMTISLYRDTNNNGTPDVKASDNDWVNPYTASYEWTFDYTSAYNMTQSNDYLILTADTSTAYSTDATVQTQIVTGALDIGADAQNKTLESDPNPLSSPVWQINAANPNLDVGNTPKSNNNVTQGDLYTNANNTTQILTLTANDGNITINTIRVTYSGSYQSDVSTVYIYKDNNGDGTYDGGDTNIGNSSSPGGGFWNVPIGQTLSENETASYGIAVDVADEATVGESFGTRIVDENDILVSSPGAVNAFISPPYTSAQLTIQDNPDNLLVQPQGSPDTATVTAGANNQLIQVLKMSTNGDKVTLNSIRITLTASPSISDNDVNANGVKAWWSADEAVGGDVQLGSGVSFSGGTATITGMNREITVGMSNILITYDLAESAMADTIGARIVDSAAVEVAPVDTVQLSSEPLTSGMHDIASGSLTVGNYARGPSNVTQGQSVDTQILTMTASAGKVVINSIRVDLNGNQSDVDLVTLFKDLNGNNAYDGGDEFVNSGNFSGNYLIFDSLNTTITGGYTVTYGFSLDINVNAPTLNTIETEVTNSGYIETTKGTVNAFGGAYQSGQFTIQDASDNMYMYQILNGDTVTTSVSNQLIQILKLTANQDKVTLNSIKITRTGTAGDGAVGSNGVKAWLSLNNDVYDGGDTGLGTASFSSGTALITGMNRDITAGLSTVLITYDIVASAGYTIGAEINSANDVGRSSPDTVNLATTPLTSSLHTIANPPATPSTLTVGASSPTPDPGDFYKGSTGHLVQRVTLTAGGGTVTVSSIKIDYNGTGGGFNNIQSLYVAEDNNPQDGQWNGNIDEPAISPTTDKGTYWLWEPGTFTISDGTTKTLLIIADVAPGAIKGNDIATRIASTTSFYSNANTTDDGGSLPSNSTLFDIKAGNIDARNNGVQPPPGSISTSSTQALHRIVLSPSAGGVTVNSIKITLSSSDLVSGHVMSVSMYRAFDGNWNLDEKASDDDWVNLDKDTNNENIFNFTPSKNLTVSVDRLILVAATSTAYTQNATFQTQIATTTSINSDAETTTIDGGTDPLNSGVWSIIASTPGTLSVSNDPESSGDATKGTGKKVIQRLSMTANDGYVTLQSITVGFSGTAVNSDVPNVYVFRDVNDDGIYNQGETPLVTVSYSGADNYNFNGINDTINSGQTRIYAVAMDVDSNAATNRTMSSSVSSQANIGLSAGNIDPFSNYNSGTFTIVAPSVVENVQVYAGLFTTAVSNMTVSWSNMGAPAYKVERATSSTAASWTTLTDSISGTPYPDTVPTPRMYYYRVSASVAGSWTTPSTVASSLDGNNNVNFTVNVTSPATIESADGQVSLYIPGSNDGWWTVQETAPPSGAPDSDRQSSGYFDFTSPSQNGTFELTLLSTKHPGGYSKVLWRYSGSSWNKNAGSNYGWSKGGDGYYRYKGDVTGFSGYLMADGVANNQAPYGPHGSYSSTGNKCKDCHAVHDAYVDEGTGQGYKLLRAGSQEAVCDFCHGATGVASKSNTVLLASGHGPSTNSGNIVAPDDEDDGAFTFAANSSNTWSCIKCHAPHAAKVVTLAYETGELFSSNKLLKNKPNPSPSRMAVAAGATLTEWCASCHSANIGTYGQSKTVAGSAVYGHDVSTRGMDTSTYGTPSDVFASVRQNVENNTDNRGPSCRQCHSVGGVNGTGAGWVTGQDTRVWKGPTASAEGSFPHSGYSNSYSLLKQGINSTNLDDVCNDCHYTPSLP